MRGAGLSRWQRIALVRDLSSAAVMDGASKHGARYARAQRQSAVELLQQSLTQAHTIFARQVWPPVQLVLAEAEPPSSLAAQEILFPCQNLLSWHLLICSNGLCSACC